MTVGVAKIAAFFSNFDVNVLTSKFGVFASQIAASSTPTELVDAESALGSWLSDAIMTIISWVYYLIYSICRFALNFVDFCEILVNKLSGLANHDQSYSLQNDFDGNPIFRFLTNDVVLTVFIALLGFAIVLLIVFAIISIVKNEYDAYSSDSASNKGPVIRRALKSCFLFLAVPFFLFIFIFSTNVVMNSVNEAFKSNLGNYSLGGQIFVSSTYNANRYRLYAQAGRRTPILFDFEDPAETGFLNVMTPEEIAAAYASWDGAEDLYYNFVNQSFANFNDTIIYKNNKIYNSVQYSGFENFATTPEEYYVLADFIDYAVGNSIEYYIKALDDPDIDWESVREKLGANYYSIVNNLAFMISYANIMGLNNGLDYYNKEYVNNNGVASTPIRDAVSVISQILAVGNFEQNTFKILERVDGFTNYVRWKSEMAKDYDGELLRVYTLTKYTYNTTTQELQTRVPQTVVLKNGSYYDARIITDQSILDEAKGEYCYSCDTSNADTKVDRVSVDTIFTLQDGSEYRDENGQQVILPKDILQVLYKEVSWPEKLYNDLSIIYSDIGIENFINNGTWNNIVSSSGFSGSISGSVNIPTAFISAYGIIMSELFLGNVEYKDENLNTSKYSSIYSNETINSLIKILGHEENYYTIIGQIEAFNTIFNNMMAQILDDAAEREGVSVEDMADSVSLNSYKQYLASIILSTEFKDYFADVSQDIVIFNKIISAIKENEIFTDYNSLEDTYKAKILEVYQSFDSGNLAAQAIYYYMKSKNPYQHEVGDYKVAETNYQIRAAELIDYSGQDINKLVTDLESERNKAIARYSIIRTEGNLNAIYAIDNQLFSIQKYLIITAFRDFVSEKTSNSINVTLNGRNYQVLLKLSTTQIAELAFGNQLKEIAGEFYSSDSNFLYVNPNYGGLVKLEIENEEIRFNSSFLELSNFLKNFGDMAFELNKSNFVNIGYGNDDSIYADSFYQIFADYIFNDLLVAFPNIAKEIGLVVLSDEKLNSLDKNQLLYLLGSSSKLNSNYRYSLVDWNVKSIDKKDNNSLGFEISMSIALTYDFELDNNGNIKDGTGITEFLSGTITSSELGINSVNFENKTLVQSLIEYWGFDFEESTIGFKFDVYSYSNDGSVGYYCLIDGQRYELEWKNYMEIAGDGSLIFNADPNKNENSGWILNYINGKQYLASGGLNATAVYIGGELVGKTLIDYRQDALNGIYNFEKRAGESNLNLSDRFLSMFYFLCSNYQFNNDVTTLETDSVVLETDSFAKNIVKTLANVMNRPDDELVGLEYSTDFNSYIKSENNGTVFIICTYDRSLEKFVPFLVATNNSSKKDFYSRYVVNPYGNEKLYFPVVARGIIDENGNPTSIMLDDNGDIVFYRDDIYIVNASKVGISMYYQSIEDVKVKGSVVSSIVNGITKLFSGKTLTEMIIEKIPRLSADTTLNFAYGSRTMNVAVVDNGYIPMSYNFSVLGIDSFYSVENLNIIILIMATIMLVMALFYAVWGLIQRILDIVVLFVIAPPIIATLPLDSSQEGIDEGRGFAAWRDKIIAAVLSAFGIIIGLNAFFLFVPYINNLEFFEPGSYGAERVMQISFMRHFADINFVNYLFRILFLLAAIGLIRRMPRLFAPLINPTSEGGIDIFSRGEKTFRSVQAVSNVVKDHISGQYAIDKVKRVAGTAKNFIPGKELLKKPISVFRKANDKIMAKVLEVAAISKGVPPDLAKKAAKELIEVKANIRATKEKQEAKEQKELAAREKARDKWESTMDYYYKDDRLRKAEKKERDAFRKRRKKKKK